MKTSIRRFASFHWGKKVTVGFGLLRGAWWRLRGQTDGWPVIHATAKIATRSGTIRLGHLAKISPHVFLYSTGSPDGPPAQLIIGDRTRVWNGTRIFAEQSVMIGKECAISWNCSILDSDWHAMSFDGDTWEPTAAPVVIEDHVWIGCHCVVLKGVTIGTGAVIGAGSVVTKDVPAHTLAAGVPAQPIRRVEAWR